MSNASENLAARRRASQGDKKTAATANVVRFSFMLHKSEKPQVGARLAVSDRAVPLENGEIELVEGYSTPGKLVVDRGDGKAVKPRMLRC